MPTDSSRFYTVLIVGFFALLISCILFFTILTEPSKVQFTGFYSLIFSEILSIGLIAALERQKKHLGKAFAKSGFYSLTIIYLCTMALVAIVYMTDIFASAKWLYTIHGICLCVLAIAFTLLFTSSQNISGEGAEVGDIEGNFKNLENRLNIIYLQAPEASWAKKVRQCQEEIHFFDYAFEVPADTLLAKSVEKLEKELEQKKSSESELTSVVEEIFAFTQQRNFEVQSKQRGQ